MLPEHALLLQLHDDRGSHRLARRADVCLRLIGHFKLYNATTSDLLLNFRELIQKLLRRAADLGQVR